jgi:hypothetical protein
VDRQRNSEVEITLPVPSHSDIGTSSLAPAVSTSVKTPSMSPSTTIVLQPDSPVDHALERYRGYSAYGPEFPSFEILYDTALWRLMPGEIPVSEPQLLAQQIPGCRIRLQAGATAAPTVSSIQLAGREWTVRLLQPDSLMYDTPYDEGIISYIFGLHLPQPYSETEKSPCQTAAEQVIDTFTIILN